MAKDLLHSISEGMSGFSKGQKLIARYIIENYDKAAFMTASKLGNTVGVSESTVVRFATEVGFEGYPQLQRALQELIRNRLTAVQRMEVTSEQMGAPWRNSPTRALKPRQTALSPPRTSISWASVPRQPWRSS